MEELQVAGSEAGDESVSLTPAEHHEPQRTTGFVIMAAIMAALGGILFGYDIGIVSGALLQLKEEFNLSCQQQEMVVSLLLVGALTGALFGGFFVDWIGRRWAIILNTAIFTAGAAILALAPAYGVLIIGRLIVGFAVSLSAIAECIYISEISPVKQRGRLVCVNEIGITLGILVAYLVNYVLISVPSGWRYMFGLSAFPALVQGLGMIFLPPSPRFLMRKGRETQARTVLQKLRGTELVEGELSNIRNSLLTEHNYKVCDVLSSVDNMRGRFLIGVGLVFFQQVTGQTNVLYYAPTIFQSLGFGSDTAATLATVGLGFIKVVTTSICLGCVDRAGRRHFLLVGAGIMTVIIITLGIVAQFSLPAETKNACMFNSSAEFPATSNIPDSQENSSLSGNAEALHSSYFLRAVPSRVQREAPFTEIQQNMSDRSQGRREYSLSTMQYISKYSNKNTITMKRQVRNRLDHQKQVHSVPGVEAAPPVASSLEHLQGTGPTKIATIKMLEYKMEPSELEARYAQSSQRALSFLEQRGKLIYQQKQGRSGLFTQELKQGGSADHVRVMYDTTRMQSGILTDTLSKKFQPFNMDGIPVAREDVNTGLGRRRFKRESSRVPPSVTPQPFTGPTLMASISEISSPQELVESTTSLHVETTNEQTTPTKKMTSTAGSFAKGLSELQANREKQNMQPSAKTSLGQTTPPSDQTVTEDIGSSVFLATGAPMNRSDVTSGGTLGRNATEVPSDKGPGFAQIVAFISLTLYVGAYSYGFGPVSWLVLSEIFPVGIRGRASSLATVFNWGTNVLVSLTFLDVMNGIGTSWTFLLYGFICALSFLFIYFIVPETKNRSLEQISAQLKKRSNLTGLAGHCCHQRAGSCPCCHGNSHQRLPITDSYSDVQSAVDQEMDLMGTNHTVM